jgi:MarR family transcriptional regulator, temperature-dependent positive regulator of motility
MKRPLHDILDGVSIPFAYKMGYVINSYREPSFRAIEAAHGLTRPEILSLIFLHFRDGISAADICDFSGHLKNNISRAITALESKGLVRREADAQDQRRLIIFITAAGRRMHDKFMPALKRREQDMMACLSASERRSLEVLLRKLCAHGPSWNGKEHGDAVAD